jgi:hypothetical protein
MDDQNEKNIKMLINLIRKYSVDTWYVYLTYSATILASQTTPDDGRIRPKHVVRKKIVTK